MSAQAIRSWHRADDSTPALARSCHQLALTQQRSFICGCCAPQLDIAPFQTGTLSASAVSSRRAPLTTFAPWECQESIAHFKAAWWLVLGPGPTRAGTSVHLHPPKSSLRLWIRHMYCQAHLRRLPLHHIRDPAAKLLLRERRSSAYPCIRTRMTLITYRPFRHQQLPL